MPQAILYPPETNALQKQLDADYTAGGTTLTLNSVTNIQNKPGVCLVNRIDSDGNLQASSEWTYFSFTGVSGSTLTGVTSVAGSTDQDHATGEVVEFVPDVFWAQMIADGFATLLSSSDVTVVNTTNLVTPTGTQTLTNKTLTSPVLNTGLSGTAFLDEDDMASNSATKVASQQSIKAYVDALGNVKATVLSRAYSGSGQSNITDTTETTVVLDTESYDVGADFNTTTYGFTVPTTGYYQINASIKWNSTIADKFYRLQVQADTSDILTSQRQAAVAGSLHVIASDIQYLTSGQVIKLIAYHSSGASTPDIASGATDTFLSIALLAA